MMQVKSTTRLFIVCLKNTLCALLMFFVATQTMAEKFNTQMQYQVLAREMLQELPKLAVDGLLEASRGDVSWTFSFMTKIEKDWVEVVEVKLERSGSNANFTDVSVVVEKETSGLFGKKTTVDTQSSEVWEKKIRIIAR